MASRLIRPGWQRELQIELQIVGKTLLERGHVEYFLGTISARIGDATFFAKSAEAHYLDIQPEDFVLVDLDGHPLEPNKTGPSLNWLVHKACYLVDPAIGGVVHAHPRKIISAISQKNPKFPKKFVRNSTLFGLPLMTEEACWVLNPSPGAPLYVQVAEDWDPFILAAAARTVIPHVNAFVIRNHGIMAVGRDVFEALGVALVIIKEAAIFLEIYESGGTPLIRSENSIRKSLKNMPPQFRWRSYNQISS